MYWRKLTPSLLIMLRDLPGFLPRNPPIWNRKMVNGVVFLEILPELFCFWQSFLATKVLFTNHMKHYVFLHLFRLWCFFGCLETQGKGPSSRSSSSNPHPGGLVVVHGGPGSGKTELAAHVRAWAMEHDLTMLSGRFWREEWPKVDGISWVFQGAAKAR